jgi:hypothetical protein
MSCELHDWRSRFLREGLTPSLRLELRDLLTPYVSISSPYRLSDSTLREVASPKIRDLVNWDIVLAADEAHYEVSELSHLPAWTDALPLFLQDATSLLRDALDLMRELEGADDRYDGSYVAQPSIEPHGQNSAFRDWTALIDILREAWLTTVRLDPELARTEVRKWNAIPYPLFKRFVFFANTKTELFTISQTVDWLLADGHWWLWSVETQREVFRLLVCLPPRLSSDDQARVENAIFAGPPRQMFKSDLEEERFQRIADREIWLRLAKLADAGLRLSEEAAKVYATLSNQYPTWQLAEDESDEFPIWTGISDYPEVTVPTPKKARDLASWILDPQGVDQERADNWQERCKSDFRRAATVLLWLARKDIWPVDRWRQALQAWSDETLSNRSWRWVGTQLLGLPPHTLKELTHPLSWWLQAIAKTFTGNEPSFVELSHRVLHACRDSAVEVADDILFKAINHPVGLVVDGLVRWWYRSELNDGQGLSSPLAEVFAEVCDRNVSIYRYGRVVLAGNTIALFRVDQKWTSANLLPLFDWRKQSDEARGVWTGFLWSPRLYRPLIGAIKSEFLLTVSFYEQLGESSEQYAALITFAALEPGDTFTNQELTSLFSSLPQAGIEHASDTLVRALEGAGDRRLEYWKNRVAPFIKRIWPKSKHIYSDTVATNFARLCVAAGDGFPDAMVQLEGWLRPLKRPDYVVRLLHRSGLSQKSPGPALEFLSTIVDEGAEWVPHDLGDCLKAIQQSAPELAEDQRFKKLAVYLRQRGHGQSI